MAKNEPKSLDEKLHELAQLPKVDKLKETRRLKKQGQWEEAERFKNELIRETKRRLRIRSPKAPPEVINFAWLEMGKAFPPLPEEGGGEEKPKRRTKPNVEKAAGNAAPEFVDKRRSPDSGGIEGLHAIPRHWGELKQEASFEADVKWCHANRLAVVKRTSAGGHKVDLKLAHSIAPSYGALGWLEFAVKNPTAFMKDIVPKAIRGDEESDVQARERMSLTEIRQVLQAMIDQAKESE